MDRRVASLPRLGPTEIVLGLTILGAALRFGTLNVQSIWLDESATMILVHRGFSGMLSHLSSSESTPPLYYILVWAWTKVFSAGPLGFRSFSALLGTLTIPVLYAAGREISLRVGLWAAALALVNPAMYYYSQEARAYGLLILLCAAAFMLWQRALRAPDGRRLALWGGVSVLALLTHYFAAFLFLPEAVVLVRRLGWRRVWAPIGAVVLTGIALLPLAVSQRADGKASWIEAASLSSRAGETVKQFLVGLYGPVEILTAVLAGLLAGGAVVLLLRRGDERERSVARDAAIVGATGLALPLLVAVTHLVRRVRRAQRDRRLGALRGARGGGPGRAPCAARRCAARHGAVRAVARGDRSDRRAARLPARRLARRRQRHPDVCERPCDRRRTLLICAAVDLPEHPHGRHRRERRDA